MQLLALDRRSLCPPAYLKLKSDEAPAPRPGARRLKAWHLAPGAASIEPASTISLVIPTQRRLKGLVTAARSTFRQTGVDFTRLELVIADNDETPSAEAVAQALAAEAPFVVRYVHERAPGVANARNAGLAAAAGELIAFLDDDEEAAPSWLAALIEAQARFGADVVFGPVKARAPARLGDHRDYLEAFFSRQGPAEAGVIGHYYGCGDSLVRRAALPHPTRPFDVGRNLTGGEDDQVFRRMQVAGARFAWAPGALVYEDPVAERLSLRYAFARAFAYGQGPTRACAATKDLAGFVRWTATGLAQALIFALVALWRFAARHPNRAFALDRMARGLGKMLWWGPFRLSFYGRPAPPGPPRARIARFVAGVPAVPEIAIG
jgi:succinoglycan biosynthesis protein ExoM